MRVKNLLKALPIGIILSSFCFAAYASSELDAIMKARGLSEKDILAAAKTYQPSGRKDEYLVFSSGGQSGQVIVYGVPSMRIYKYIAVFHLSHGRAMATMKNPKKFSRAVRSMAAQ